MADKWDAIFGPDLLLQVVDAARNIPPRWAEKTMNDGFRRLRLRLRLSQAEVGRRTKLTQARVSRIEGGADVRLSVWLKLYAALGFELVAMPVAERSLEQLSNRGGRAYSRRRLPTRTGKI